jgi:prevent-host-death family protein
LKTVEIDEATASLAEYAEEAASEPVVVTREGKPIAAVFPIVDGDWESIRLSTNPEFLRIIEESRKKYDEKGGISAAQMRRRLAT